MIGTEFINGQGLGNQLFCYVVSRCVATELGYEFGTAGQSFFANNIHSHNGMYFMDIDLGTEITDISKFNIYKEKEKRLFLRNSMHDMKNGCYVAGADPNLFLLPDNTLIYGNLQAEDYFYKYKTCIVKWLHVKSEFDNYEFYRDNLCIINFRGGEYVSHAELFLNRNYWNCAMTRMKEIRQDMEFVVITEDVKAARIMFPDLVIHHLDMGSDYCIIKNAKYLVLSNSSFAFFPAYTSETVKFIIAPKYWARFNVSDGYWASEQNIYSKFNYMDREGKIFTAKECRIELECYKASNEWDKLGSEGRKKLLGAEYEIKVLQERIKAKLKKWRH